MEFWKKISLHLYFLFLFEEFKTNVQTNLIQNSLFYSPLNMISHCIRMCLSLVMSVFCLEPNTLVLETDAFCAGDKHFSAGDERVENECSNFSHTHTQLATSDYQTKLMSRWLLVTATHIWTQVLSCCGDPKGTYRCCACTTVSSIVQKGLEKDQAHRENQSTTFSHIHRYLYTRKLVAVYCTCIGTYNFPCEVKQVPEGEHVAY